ncbi:helicase [Bifidobacterium sp. W8101]|uniref:DISARM system helicase DrmA n=1 Tax=Bifidobacterium TaxID=1678 RepID=UPI001D54C203|nr:MULTISPECIES: DISARM system helicase DrmA [Bifidobacterium]MBI0126289.1 helicase [Bifidobacterium choladohabitans]MBI0127858.1 helicase [Bifidobacterium sp. W8103]MBI0138446.1 helicase [Bifidobacterium sp. W8105]MBI0148584.1 helicase [Bifidobacterium sp. W8107]
MPDRFKYAEVRQKIIDAIRTDLIGPCSSKEKLDENPRYAYLVGKLEPQRDENAPDENEQEIEADIDHDKGEDFTSGKDDDNEPISTTKFELPSSIGISFYVESSLDCICLDVTWGDYTKSTEKNIDKDGKEHSHAIYKRIPEEETVQVKFSDFARTKDYPLVQDSNVHVHVSRIPLKDRYSLITAYVVNKRSNPSSDVEGLMFQVGIKAHAEDGSAVFIAEHICRNVLATDEFYFEQRPIMGRGRGCAAVWGNTEHGRTNYVESAFIPEYEYPGVSAALKGFSAKYFSTWQMAAKGKKADTLHKLKTLADSYENWIKETLESNPRMNDQGFQEQVGNLVIDHCRDALRRIRAGIQIIETDEISFEAFSFMNSVIFMQNSIKNYAKKHGKGIECNFEEFLNPNNPKNEFAWRPFQIAFILMNLKGIVHQEDPERGIVDLLYFPTGGGKTEAYLGLMAFTIANRRLRASDADKYNHDGGVTIILRYTLRLLTTQQRDRITRMVVAAELVRQKSYPCYGSEPISIGFWVGGGVTPNKFEDLKEKPEKSYETRSQKKLLYKQLLTCPLCGRPLTKDDFYISPDEKSVEIYCSDKNCKFYKYSKNEERTPIPVYLVDEEIYAKCPTIILSTVDKFARLPWDVNTNALFGRVNRKCSRHGYIAIGAKHAKHRRTASLPAAEITPVKPFLSPELIIQDELHLITGPLGTVYGAYETIIENMCTHDGIKPKYVVSTATIKNADNQAKSLYARNTTKQFPPNGFEIGDSFFIREIPVGEDPFRKYVGICAPGQSMKTALLRTYAIILQAAYTFSLQEKYKDVIDPYYSLIGYFNSIRELGGTVRLLQDDIPDRIKRIQKRYHCKKRRFLNKNDEITSRMSSWKIPEKLNQLELPYTSKDCIDTALATNMIAAGMDVDRLGLMVVTGQPKQNSEYIQATSRIGRAHPGLVVTLYNAYRPRDLSHYENFTGYHTQLYRFVEGTTATPFSARARDRVLHALVISAIRLLYPEMADNKDAAAINSLSQNQINVVKKMILDRIRIVKPSARVDTNEEIDQFIDWWKSKATQDNRPLRYYVLGTEKYSRLMNGYEQLHIESEKPTLRSMRDVESAANMYYYTEE